MDAVYICRAGDNEELRYSLRSLVNLTHDRVWLFGVGPGWYCGERVFVAQSGNKYENARRAIEAACLDPRVSDPFILMNDDFYITQPASCELLDRGRLCDVIDEQAAIRPTGQYLKGMRMTLKMLQAYGYPDPLSFGLHVPMPIRKIMMLGVLALTAEAKSGLHLRTVYGNVLGDPSRTISDVKLCRALRELPPGPWLSTGDGTFRTARPLLDRMFPEASQYEEVTVKVKAIKGFRDSEVGRRRQVGEEWDVTPERAVALNATRFGQLVEVFEDPALEPEPVPEPEPVEAPVPEPAPQTVKDIKAILDARGIEYRGVTRKADLLKLL